MKLIKKFSTLMMILCLTLSVVGCSESEIIFSSEYDLESIFLSESNGKDNLRIEFSDAEEIKNILNIIKSNSKKTKMDSVAETPTNLENYIVLESLYSTDKGKINSFDYIYKQKNKYYLEQPYGGIWSITEKSYDNINKLINP